MRGITPSCLETEICPGSENVPHLLYICVVLILSVHRVQDEPQDQLIYSGVLQLVGWAHVRSWVMNSSYTSKT
jgi:hypothetical protein